MAKAVLQHYFGARGVRNRLDQLWVRMTGVARQLQRSPVPPRSDGIISESFFPQVEYRPCDVIKAIFFISQEIAWA